jgi:putative membrane protein insertion efficiency factor
MKYPFLLLIRLYQKTLSFDHGPLRKLYPHGYCRFQPTCSEYAYQAIDRHGAFWGLLLGGWRILRCNPWNKGGKDSVPEKVRFALKRK